MNKPCDQLNKILEEWHREYDLEGVVSAQFSHRADDQLCLNGVPVYTATEINGDLLSADLSAEEIAYTFADGQALYVHFKWAEDRAPALESASFVQSFPAV